MLASYAAEYGINYVGARMSHTFGPGTILDDGRSFSEFIGCALKGEDIVLHSDGSAVRPYTYVADAIGGILLIASRGETNTYYNIANLNNQASIKEVAEIIAGMSPQLKSKVIFENEKSEFRFLNFKLGVMNTEKIEKLGWRPMVDIKTAFRYTMESFEQNR
jgi:nucleoside-diphosphate-sugar epimerase